MVEQQTSNLRVGGSIPLQGTIAFKKIFSMLNGLMTLLGSFLIGAFLTDAVKGYTSRLFLLGVSYPQFVIVVAFGLVVGISFTLIGMFDLLKKNK